MPAPKRDTQVQSHRLPAGVLCILLATGLCALAAQTVLQAASTATTLFSAETWQRVVMGLGGSFTPLPSGGVVAEVPFARLFFTVLAVAAICWTAGAWWISRRSGGDFRQALGEWGLWGWLWWVVGGVWEVARLLSFTVPFSVL